MKECLNALRGQGYNPAYLSAWARKKSSRRMAWCAMQGSNLQPYDSKSYTVARNASPHRCKSRILKSRYSSKPDKQPLNAAESEDRRACADDVKVYMRRALRECSRSEPRFHSPGDAPARTEFRASDRSLFIGRFVLRYWSQARFQSVPLQHESGEPIRPAALKLPIRPRTRSSARLRLRSVPLPMLRHPRVSISFVFRRKE